MDCQLDIFQLFPSIGFSIGCFGGYFKTNGCSMGFHLFNSNGFWKGCSYLLYIGDESHFYKHKSFKIQTLTQNWILISAIYYQLFSMFN